MEPISLPEPAILLSVDLPMLKGGAVRKQPFYTADQLRAAMEAERFACMEIAMAHAANKTPPYKPYEDTYLDGWQDAGNQIGWAIRDRGTT